MSQLQAIGGHKYTVALNSQINIQDFEVIRPCNSLLMRLESLEDIWIRIQFEDKNYRRTSMVSDIKLTDYLSIMQRLYSKCQVRNVTVLTDELDENDQRIEEDWIQFLLPLSINGDLDLSANNKLVIQMYQKTEDPQEVRAYFEYYCTGEKGYPIYIDREKILQSEDFTERDFEGFDYAFFPEDVKFEYVQYPQEGYAGGSRQTTYDQANYDAAIYDLKNDITLANGGVLFDTRFRSTMTISHVNEDDITLYKIDCVAPNNLIRTAVAKGMSNTAVNALKQKTAEIAAAQSLSGTGTKSGQASLMNSVGGSGNVSAASLGGNTRKR